MANRETLKIEIQILTVQTYMTYMASSYVKLMTTHIIYLNFSI